SAGGHLASTAGTHFDAGNAGAADPIDRVSSRPDFLVLCYPVVTFGQFAHRGSLQMLLGDNPDPKLVENLSNELQVTPQTPPTFLFHTTTDTTVPVENSVQFYMALRKAGVPAEMHIYERGPHGVGLAPTDAALSTWLARLADWLGVRGVLNAAAEKGVCAAHLPGRARDRLDDFSVRPMDRDFDFIRGVRREVGIAAAMNHPAAVHEHGKANKSRDCGFHCPMLLRRAVGRNIGPTGVEDGAELEVGAAGELSR